MKWFYFFYKFYVHFIVISATLRIAIQGHFGIINALYQKKEEMEEQEEEDGRNRRNLDGRSVFLLHCCQEVYSFLKFERYFLSLRSVVHLVFIMFCLRCENAVQLYFLHTECQFL